MIAIVDYGVGNIFSLYSSFSKIGAEVKLTGSRDEIEAADKIVLPGVGAFEDAARKLRETGLGRVVIEQAGKGKPLVGICLGMQLLFDKSYEYGEHEGLGLIRGNVVSMAIFCNTNEGDHVYFVHSYYGTDCDDALIATTEYGPELTAAVADGNVYGLQFHPEKSGDVGLNILRAFCGL